MPIRALFEGRIGRLHYFWGASGLYLIRKGGETVLSPDLHLILLIVLLPLSLFFIVRRLHDINMSGWWILPLVAIQLLGPASFFVKLVSTAAGLFLLFKLGTPGTNKYGSF